MRSRNVVAAAVVVLGIATLVVHEFTASDAAQPIAENQPTPPTAPVQLSAARPQIDSASNAAPTSVAAAPSLQTASAPPPPPPADLQLDSQTGTADAPGDPSAQQENPSEQFMHSRRGDGQHSE
jgi:type IV secretory pathway VirB10-like protein